jgi:hypothetical protein
MLTKKTPESIKAHLTVKAQGVDNSLMLTYFNHSPEAYEKFVSNPENMKPPEPKEGEKAQSDTVMIAHINAALVLFLVKSFDDGTDEAFPLNLAGLVDLERHWPGTLLGLIRGYHQARAAAIEKN